MVIFITMGGRWHSVNKRDHNIKLKIEVPKGMYILPLICYTFAPSYQFDRLNNGSVIKRILPKVFESQEEILEIQRLQIARCSIYYYFKCHPRNITQTNSILNSWQ